MRIHKKTRIAVLLVSLAPLGLALERAVPAAAAGPPPLPTKTASAAATSCSGQLGLPTTDPQLVRREAHPALTLAPRADLAQIVVAGIPTTFGPELCGFKAGSISSALYCSSSETCAFVGSAICCASRGLCTGLFSSCIEGSEYAPSYIAGGNTLLCTAGFSSHCNYLVYPPGYTQYECATTPQRPSASSLYPPSFLLSYYAGYTLSFISPYGGDWLRFVKLVTPSTVPNRTATATPTNAVGFLSKFGANVPACAANITTACPSLYSMAQTCWKITNPKACICPGIANSTCPGLCRTGEQPIDYINWVLKMCQAKGVTTLTKTGITAAFATTPSGTGITMTSTRTGVATTLSGAEVANKTAGAMKFASSWRDFDDLQRAARASLFPWRWRVQYSQATVRNVTDSKGYRCPSNSLKLGSFAVINVVVAIAAVFLGRRDVVSGITGGWCGKRDKDSNKRQGCCGKPGSNTWPFMALISVGLNLLANYINALIIHGTPGFSGVSIGGLVLLWCSRPRLAWISTLLVRREKEKSMYFALGASSLMTEVVLQAVGSVYIGTTVNFARQHRYYRIHRLDNILDGNDALIMYGGAMLWMVAIGSALIWAVLAFTSIGRLLKQASKAIWRGISRIWSTIRSIFRWIRCRPRREVQEWPQPHPLDLPPARRPGLRPRPPPYPRRPGTSDSYDTGLDWEDDLEKMGLSVESVERISTVFAFMALPFIGQWLFWAGFLRLSSDLYCPPEIWKMTTVWSIFSVLGVFFGSTV